MPAKHDYLTCPYCGFDDIPNGAMLCRGCKAEIVYEATGEERKEGCSLGGGCALLLAGLAFYADQKLAHVFQATPTVVAIIHLCFWGSLPVALVIGLVTKGNHDRMYDGQARFFRRFRHRR